MKNEPHTLIALRTTPNSPAKIFGASRDGTTVLVADCGLSVELSPEEKAANAAYIVRALIDRAELAEAGLRLVEWAEGYQRLANEKGGRYAVAISSCRSDVELFRAAIAAARADR